jgi:exodeoxyribonuclease V beta subunit
VASEPEQDTVSDELLDGPAGGATGSDEVRLRAVELPLGVMPGGADVGDLVHRVLEAADFDAADLDAELLLRLHEQRARRDVELGDEAAVIAGLRLALETPLGPLGGERRLRDVPRGDRLDEVVFELPLAGGEHPTGTLELEAVAALLEARLAPGDPLTGYAERLREPGLRDQLRGFLTGFLDLVVRAREPDGRAGFTVVDYKTNWLGAEGEELSAWHYRPEALAEAMQRAHYPLQALLYLVALHRYLRWRQPGYEPARDLGAVHYLFLRGMTGADVPRVDGQPCGVFSWRPPAGLVEALSDLLDRGGAA